LFIVLFKRPDHVDCRMRFSSISEFGIVVVCNEHISKFYSHVEAYNFVVNSLGFLYQTELARLLFKFGMNENLKTFDQIDNKSNLGLYSISRLNIEGKELCEPWTHDLYIIKLCLILLNIMFDSMGSKTLCTVYSNLILFFYS